jgi:hypothetical protein
VNFLCWRSVGMGLVMCMQDIPTYVYINSKLFNTSGKPNFTPMGIYLCSKVVSIHEIYVNVMLVRWGSLCFGVMSLPRLLEDSSLGLGLLVGDSIDQFSSFSFVVFLGLRHLMQKLGIPIISINVYIYGTRYLRGYGVQETTIPHPP